LRHGHRQKYALSVSGGGQALQYYMSGQFDSNEGVLPLDEEKKTAVRGNFTFSPLSMVTGEVNSGYTRTDIWTRPARTHPQGLTLNTSRRERHSSSTCEPEPGRMVRHPKTTTPTDRSTLGGTVNVQPVDDRTNRLTIGNDQPVQDNGMPRPCAY